MSNEHELLVKLKTYKRRVYVLLAVSSLLFPYGLYRISNGHTQTGLFTLLPAILGLAMGINYLRVILRHEKVLQEVIAAEKEDVISDVKPERLHEVDELKNTEM